MWYSKFSDFSAFKTSVKRTIDSKILPYLREWESKDEFPNSVFTDLAEQGFLGILISEEFGGVGGDYLMAAAWCDTFGTLPDIGLTTAVNMHSLVISHALEKFGTATAKEKWLPKSVTGEAIGAYAFTEPNAGSDLKNIRTKASKTENGWLLNGAKTFITNGARADYCLVLARNDFDAGYRGFTTFVVDTKAPGFKVARKLDKLGWRTSDTAELVLEDVEVNTDSVLGKVGDGWIQASKNLSWERLMLTLLSLAGARTCLSETIKYCTERTAFGKPLSEISGVKGILTEMKIKLNLAEALTSEALDVFLEKDTEKYSEEVVRKTVALAKRSVCDDCVWLADRAIQLHGGYGYTKEYNPEKWWRELRLMPIGGGTSEIMANIVIK